MKNFAALSLMALSVVAQAADNSHRLAYSKAENVEVFVDHASGQPWCSSALNMRFAFGGAANQNTLERLLPKLGGLLASQCPQAESLNWQSLDQNGQLQAQGTASKSGAWIAQVTQSAPASAAPPALADNTPAPATTPASVAADPPAQPVAASASAAAAAPTAEPIAAEPITAGPIAAEPIVEPTTTQTTAAPTATVAAPAVLSNDFSVAGWKPPLESDVLAQASFLSIIQDQGGCRFRTSYKQEGDSQFIQAESTGISCGPDGFASGTGQLLLKRSDGVELKRIKASFHRGLPITDGTLDLPVVGFDEEQNMLLWLSSDPVNRVHYLVRAKHNRYAGSWHLEQPLLLALTDNAELFRQAESIRTILFAPLAQLDKQRPKETWINAYAMRDLAKGLLKGDRDAWLYEVGLQRNYRSKLWDFDPNRANNHLFAFERKQAEIARREAEQKAREEQRLREQVAYQAEEQLRLFDAMQEQSRNPRKLMASLIDDVGLGSGYRALMRGEARDIRQVVHIDGKQDDAWVLDYPYEARLSADDADQEPENGWYLIQGKVSLDTSKRDGEELPLTLIAANSLLACADPGCADLRDPLKLTRQRLNNPEWTPEEAKNQVRAAWPDRYPQAQVQE